MAFSPSKPTQTDQKANHARENSNKIEVHPPINPPKMAEQAAKVSWIQVPGQPVPNPVPLSLPTIRPISPLQGDVFGDSLNRTSNKPVKESPRAQSPKRQPSPVRKPVVNTFAQQAQQLQQLELETHNKVGRQLSATSTVPSGPDKLSSPTESPDDDASSSPKTRFFSHFRKRPRKRMSGNDDAPETSMPISPAPQLRPIQLGGDKSLRNSIVMEDFFEDAKEEFEGDLMKQVEEALSVAYRSQHITIAPSAIKPINSHPPSSHKDGAIPSVIPAKVVTRHPPSPYPTTTVETSSKVPPITIPKRGSSRKLTVDPPDRGTSSRSRRQNPTASSLPRIIDDVVTTTIPGAYPLSSSPEMTSAFERHGSIPMSRSTTNLSVNLPGAYPREPRNRYNSSSSGLSSAASYRTAFEPETWDTEDQKQKDEQIMLQQSLMEATRAMRALEKYTDWTERKPEKSDLAEELPLRDSPVNAWPTPPYIDDDPMKRGKRMEIDYFRFGIPSPSEHRS
jgi:hypothetical protein